jgi:hypothetical protein
MFFATRPGVSASGLCFFKDKNCLLSGHWQYCDLLILLPSLVCRDKNSDMGAMGDDVSAPV